MQAKRALAPRFQSCLETLVATSNLMDGVIRQIDMDEGVFGFPHSEIIGREDMEQIFKHLELGIGVMHSYIWYSDQSILYLVEQFIYTFQ